MNKLAIASLLAVTSMAWGKGDFENKFNKQMRDMFPRALERKELLLNNTFSDDKLGYIATLCKEEYADQTTLDLITKNIEKNIAGSTRYCDKGYCMVAIRIVKTEITDYNEEIF